MVAVREPEQTPLYSKRGSWNEVSSPYFMNFLDGVMGGDVEEGGLNQKNLVKSCAQSFQVSAGLDSVTKSLAKMEWASLISI